MVKQGIARRSSFLLACLLCIGSACGSDDGNSPRAAYPCLVGALVLPNFSGSCDTRASSTTPGECRAWYGNSTAVASQACTDLGGTFDEVERCPSTGRVLRCAIEDSASRILHSYYAPNYSEASAAELCSSRGGKCVRGPGD
jgi:hypothetical protein